MRNVVKASLVIFLCFSAISFKSDDLAPVVFSQANINWLSWQDMLEKSKKERRKVVVDVYTDWCGWCKRMDATTFQHPQIAKYINEHYYAVKFNAEDRKDIDFKGKTFKFVKNGMRGYHELAALITQGRLSYPSIVFLDENHEVIQSIPGYRDAVEFEKIVTYFGGNQHQKTPWEVYQRNYQPMKD